MPTDDPRPTPVRHPVTRRDFLKRAGVATVGITPLVAAASRARASAETPSPYPDWMPPSTKPPKRGKTLVRASAWDPPVLDPRLTNSVGLFQIASLTSSRLVRYPFSDEAANTTDLTLKGDLAESWQGSPDFRVWTFKLRKGVKWHNVPPLNGRELVAQDIKFCFEAYAKEGVQSFTFQEIEGIETPDKYTVRVHLKMPNTMFPQNLAEPVSVIFPREVLEEDGDLKKRIVGTGPFILKEHTRKVRVVLVRNPDYFDTGRPYLDEYHILSTPDAATRLAAFRSGQSDIHFVASLADAAAVLKTTPGAVVQEYKPAEAKKLLGEAGHPNGFESTLFYYEYFPEMTSQVQLVQQDLKRNLNIEIKISKLDYTTFFGRYADGKWDGMAWGFKTGYATGLDEQTYQYMHSKSTKNYWRFADPVIDELVTKLRKTPDRAEQRALTKKVLEREHDQVLRMWMPYDAGFLSWQPYLRNTGSLALRRNDGYGASTLARLWIDK